MSERVEPTFEAPPLVEVVCGLQFRPLSAFQAAHYGLFWSQIQDDFPRTRTVPPIGTPVEVPINEPTELTVQVNKVDLPRVWFVSGDGTCLVQLQPDWFLFNWREGPSGAPYPRFKWIIARFRELYESFEQFLDAAEIGKPHLLGTSVTYINHIKLDDRLESYGSLVEAFPDLAWRRGARFLPTPDTFFFRSNHKTSDGTLQAVVQSAKTKPDATPLIRFDLIARASIEEIEFENFWDWYEAANTWIVDAFIDLTSERFQKEVWRRTQ